MELKDKISNKDQNVSNPFINLRPDTRLLLVFILLIVLALTLSGILIYNKYKNLQTENSKLNRSVQDLNEKIENPRFGPFEGFRLLDEECSSETCLFTKDTENVLHTVEGFAKLKGYYETETRDYFDKEFSCDTLVVTGGSQSLIDHFTSWIRIGNTVNSLDKEGNVVLNLDLTEISSLDNSKIKASNPNNEVELSVIRRMSEDRGAAPCESFVNIIKADSVD